MKIGIARKALIELSALRTHSLLPRLVTMIGLAIALGPFSQGQVLVSYTIPAVDSLA